MFWTDINNFSSSSLGGLQIRKLISHLGTQPPDWTQTTSIVEFLKCEYCPKHSRFSQKMGLWYSTHLYGSIDICIKEWSKLICFVTFTNFSSDVCIHTPT